MNFQFTWKFNNSLLRDEEFVKKVKDDIKQVIEEYECDLIFILTISHRS
jgi:hypothetical protein